MTFFPLYKNYHDESTMENLGTGLTNHERARLQDVSAESQRHKMCYPDYDYGYGVIYCSSKHCTLSCITWTHNNIFLYCVV